MTPEARFGLEGENVYLRALEPDDLKLIHRWQNNSCFMRLDSFMPEHVISLAALEKKFEKDLKGEVKGRKTFTIVKKDGDVPLGMASFRGLDGKSRTATVGLGIGDVAERNAGYGTEAMHILLKLLFEEMNIHRVELKTLADNENAIAAFMKCGFEEEGRLRESVFFDGKYHDLLVMGIIKSD